MSVIGHISYPEDVPAARRAAERLAGDMPQLCARLENGYIISRAKAHLIAVINSACSIRILHLMPALNIIRSYNFHYISLGQQSD